ncbi:MAG: class I SAM-dependent methyltransferase [Bradymonadia bacterium]
MRISENLLFLIARQMMKRKGSVSEEFSEKLSSADTYNDYRTQELERILAAAEREGIIFAGKDVLDLGSGPGAIAYGLHATGGARSVVGVDIKPHEVDAANARFGGEHVRFVLSGQDGIPLPDASVDVINSFDVFEHVSNVPAILEECHRILRPGGEILIGTWGWYHPFAPHYWHLMPVPWAHVVFSEKTFMRACRRIYLSDVYTDPLPFELDENGEKDMSRHNIDYIPDVYVNKLLIKDFERHFESSPFNYKMTLIPLGPLKRVPPVVKLPLLKELLTGYLWVKLTKR